MRNMEISRISCHTYNMCDITYGDTSPVGDTNIMEIIIYKFMYFMNGRKEETLMKCCVVKK